MRVDPERLREQLRYKGLTAKKASIDAGYSESYLGVSMGRGKISKPMALHLRRQYGINESDYEYVPQPKAEAQKQPGGVIMPILSEICYRECLRALRDFMNEAEGGKHD